MSDPTKWPALPLSAWRDTCETLHRWAQIVGKIELACTPVLNHWWNVGLQATPRGLATSTLMATDSRTLDLELDFFADVLRIRVSDGESATIALAARPVADFYEETLATLAGLGIHIHLLERPCEIVDAKEAIPFSEDRLHRDYDKPYVLAYRNVVSHISALLTRFRAHFVGKSSPPLVFWGHFDLALSLFSGRPTPAPILAAMTDKLDREGYSHELLTIGWWPGDSRLPKPTFYAAASPEPVGFATTNIACAHYEPTMHCFLLDYDTIRSARDPDAMLLDFCRESYRAAADLGHWDRNLLERSVG